MKKWFFGFSSIVLILILSILLFSKAYEDRLIGAFKKQIIDKTNINIDFEEIRFSILRYFPYGSFTLDNAKIFYSKYNRNDTLLNAKKLCLKINIRNLFRKIYEFPEIIITDGSINIRGELVDTLFKSNTTENEDISYLIETKNITLNNCKIKYSYENTTNFDILTNQSTFSGSFLPNSLSIKLNLNINYIEGRLRGLRFKTNDFIQITSTVKHNNDSYFSENGEISKGTIGIGFSFVYNKRDEFLQIKSNTEKVSAKTFFKEFVKDLDITPTKGRLSYESLYSINFRISKSQKLTISYIFDNIGIEGYTSLSILNLKGKTTFTNNLDKNYSEVERYLIHYNGFEMVGSSMIKNLPKPTVLIDTKIKSLREIRFNKDYVVNGKINGNIKALIKIDDINKLDYKDLKIDRILSELTLQSISINSIDYIKEISGTLKLQDDELSFNGKGILFNEDFKGTLKISEFMNFATRKAMSTPKISIEMNRLNLDSAFVSKSAYSSDSINYELHSKITSLKYKGLDIKDFTINITNKNGLYNCDYIKLKAFKGEIKGHFTYSNDKPSNVSFTGQDLDIQSLFKNYNNFGQTVVTASNISGSLSGTIDMSYKMLENNKIDPSSIKMVSNIVIEKGKLSGVNQLKRLSKFLNVNELDSFRFNTIRNRIDIENGLIKIPTMDIVSNALNFQISGKHGFNGEFTYWLKLNLKEILAKKYLQNKTFTNDYERDSRNGLNLFLKIHGNNESYKVEFDKKNSIEQFKSKLSQEGLLLKSIIKEEFGLSKKNVSSTKESISTFELNKFDSTNNKKPKKPFKIEWDEIDTTKNNNQ